MKRVIVESPYAGNIILNIMYAQFACHDCLVNHNEAPYASHLLYTQPHILRDEIDGERELGIKAGFDWREAAEQSNFYIDLGTSSGMLLGMEDCEAKSKSFTVRHLPQKLWDRFQQVREAEGLQMPKR